jgi:hypothetical protein
MIAGALAKDVEILQTEMIEYDRKTIVSINTCNNHSTLLFFVMNRIYLSDHSTTTIIIIITSL